MSTFVHKCAGCRGKVVLRTGEGLSNCLSQQIADLRYGFIESGTWKSEPLRAIGSARRLHRRFTVRRDLFGVGMNNDDLHYQIPYLPPRESRARD